MRLIEIIKSFGKFRRKKSPTTSLEGGNIPTGTVNAALDQNSIDNSSSSTLAGPISESEDLAFDSLPSSSSSSCDSTPSPTTTTPRNVFSVRNHLLLSAWRRMKRIRAIGILCALASVVFWSFNGLLIKLNQLQYGIHALETLMISSSIVSLTYLCFIFTCYGRRPTTGALSNSISSMNSSKSSSISTLDSASTEANLRPSDTLHNNHCDWTIILGVEGERFSLFLRCFLGTISLATFYCSYIYIPLSDATTIRFTSPVFIAIFAHFLVAEPFGLLQVVNSCTTLAGVVLIGRPSFLFTSPPTVIDGNQPSGASPLIINETTTSLDGGSSPPPSLHYALYHNLYEQLLSNDSSNFEEPEAAESTSPELVDQFQATLVGVLLALVSAITISISMIYMRRMKKTPAPLVIFWFSLSNVILGAVGLIALGAAKMPQDLESWMLIGSTTLCSGLDQLFITLALKLENAGAVAVIQALCVVLSFLFSTLILQETLYWTSALGGSFIFLSVIVLGLAKMAAELKRPYSEGERKHPPPLAPPARTKRIFALNLVQHCSSTLSISKSKSFDILAHSVGDTAYQNADLPPTTNTPIMPLPSDVLNEPYLLRMAPFTFDGPLQIKSTTPTTTVIDDNNNL